LPIAELLSGRVKTLHPKVFAAVLADQSDPAHAEQLRELGIEPFCLVAVNFYPFVQSPGIETIDIGGPSLVRAAAKNYQSVAVIVDPSDYEPVAEELKADGQTSLATRLRLAAKAFRLVEAYDAEIARYFEGLEGTGKASPFPRRLVFQRAGLALRYGENPHQRAELLSAGEPDHLGSMRQLAGKDLSYLNIVDVDYAWSLVSKLAAQFPGETAAAIIKHANACGAAVHGEPVVAFEKALSGDPEAAFGGVFALSSPMNRELALAVAQGPQADVIIAPSFDADATEVLTARRKATRLLEMPPLAPPRFSLRQVGRHFLVQEPDEVSFEREVLQVVVGDPLPELVARDAKIAYLTCAMTWSNAITIVKGSTLVGVGAGQQSRVEAARLAASKAGQRAEGAVAASDAFFPFPDGVKVLAEAGVTTIVEPGGSIRDEEVKEEARRLGVTLVFTGYRHFRH
jgi:phosphoribosylaminoimidazolecarboxamide formyltransferase/IMP cyclohydrolase